MQRGDVLRCNRLPQNPLRQSGGAGGVDDAEGGFGDPAVSGRGRRSLPRGPGIARSVRYGRFRMRWRRPRASAPRRWWCLRGTRPPRREQIGVRRAPPWSRCRGARERGPRRSRASSQAPGPHRSRHRRGWPREADLVAHHHRVSIPVPHTERGQRRGQASGAHPYLRVGTDVVAATYDCFGRRHRIPSVSRTMQRASTATRPSSVTRSGLTSSDSIQPWHAAASCPKPTRRSASCARCQGSDPR